MPSKPRGRADHRHRRLRLCSHLERQDQQPRWRSRRRPGSCRGRLQRQHLRPDRVERQRWSCRTELADEPLLLPESGIPSPARHGRSGAASAHRCPRRQSADATGCVEVWAGKNLLIDATAGNGGQVSADMGKGAGKSLWIDLFAGLDITISNDSQTAFVVHANEGGSNGTGGDITVKSVKGKITMSGAAIQADGTGSNFPDGGKIVVEAASSVKWTGSRLRAGSFPLRRPRHGWVHCMYSYTGNISWTTGTGDVRPTGTGVATADRGTIILTCGPPSRRPAPRSRGPRPPRESQLRARPLPAPGPAAALRRHFQPTSRFRPAVATCRHPLHASGAQRAVLSQVVQNMGKCCAVPDILVDLRWTSMTTVDPSRVGTDQPATGSLQAAVDYIMAHGDIDGDGQLFIGVTAQNCGTGTVGEGSECEGQGGRGPNGGGIENVVIQNTRQERLNVFGCSVNLAAADVTKPGHHHRERPRQGHRDGHPCVWQRRGGLPDQEQR